MSHDLLSPHKDFELGHQLAVKLHPPSLLSPSSQRKSLPIIALIILTLRVAQSFLGK
jgi:hypothetical protein